MKVLIGYDGSACADDAITDLARAGLPADTHARVLTAVDVFPPNSFAEIDQPLPPTAAVIAHEVRRARALAEVAISRASEMAEQAAERVRRQFAQWTVQSDTRADAPHWALVGAAADWEADLIVVGSQGRSGLGRLLLGSVSESVLHYAPCSVRIGRHPMGRDLPREPRIRLVLGADGSADSATAVSAVAARYWPAGSEVHAVGVLDSRAVLAHLRLGGAQPTPRGDNDAAALSGLAESLAGVSEALHGSGLATTTRLIPGDPKKVLLQEAERVGADCIVVGGKGHSRLERLLLGSVSAAIAARACCSVEVVRAA